MAGLKLNKIAGNVYYASILQNIESLINMADEEASDAGISLTDSQVKSIVTKVRGKSQGKEPKLGTPQSDKDRFLLEMYHSILLHGEQATSNKSASAIPRKDWLLCLSTVLDSIKRHQAGSGSRNYLDFISQFV